MASLIGWLAYDGARTSSGTTVASGRAWFYQPGTTATTVTVYSNADGTTALTQPVALDAGGRATVYTNTVCRVEVQDATNATVLVTDRANAVQAAQVEIQNVAATGTDLATGVQVAGGRTDLNTFISSLYASLGAADGKVLVGGSGQYIKDVVGSSTSVFFNVKSSSYGALGDDSNNDTNAIAAAVNAAVAAGGGVIWFPPGTYKVAGTITITSAKIRFMAATPGAVTIKQYTSGAYSLTTDTAPDFVCDGIAFTAGAAGGELVSVSNSSTNNRFNNCSFTCGTVNQAINVAASLRTYFTACVFNNAQTNIPTFGLGTGAEAILTGGSFNMTGSSTGAAALVVASGGTCYFNATGVYFDGSGAVNNVIIATSGVQGIFSGCHFPSSSGTLALGGSSSVVYESGNLLGTNVTVGVSTNISISTWRDGRILTTSGVAITYTPNAALYKFHDVTSSGASFAWVNPVDTGASGYAPELVLRYKNTNAGAITPTFGTAYKMSAVSVASGSACGWLLYWSSSFSCWVQVGAPVAYTS